MIKDLGWSLDSIDLLQLHSNILNHLIIFFINLFLVYLKIYKIRKLYLYIQLIIKM